VIEGGLLKYVFVEVNYLDATIEKFSQKSFQKVMKMRDIKRTCMFLNFFFFSSNLNFPEFVNSFRQEQYMAILEIDLC